jgi:aldose 1-epimerase
MITFGHTADGEEIKQVTLVNKHGVSVDIITLGATIRRFRVPIYDEEIRDIVLGFDELKHYLSDDHYLGCVVGRYANRIHKGRFTLGDEAYQLDINQAGNCLHGGSSGFNQRVWQVDSATGNELCLSLFSPDGDQGFPGNLTLGVTYSLSEDNRLTIKYKATSDKETLINPTQHSYFNLDGHNANSIEQHRLTVSSDHILDVDGDGIPNSQFISVAGRGFDFNQQKAIADALNANEPLIQHARGLDHNWCLKQKTKHEVSAYLTNATQDLELQVSTTMPGLQIYTGNFLPTHSHGKNNAVCAQYQGVCLETQFYPDSPNHSAFTTPTVRAGETFISETSYRVVVR